MTNGLKLDSGKLAYHLLDAEALAEQVAVLTYGGILYEPGNWAHVEDADDRYFDALQRHLRDARRGRSIDPESSLLSLAHAACCIHFLLAIELRDGEHAPLEERLKVAVENAKRLREKRLAVSAPAPAPEIWAWRVLTRRGKIVAAGRSGSKQKGRRAARDAIRRRGMKRAKVEVVELST